MTAMAATRQELRKRTRNPAELQAAGSALCPGRPRTGILPRVFREPHRVAAGCRQPSRSCGATPDGAQSDGVAGYQKAATRIRPSPRLAVVASLPSSDRLHGLWRGSSLTGSRSSWRLVSCSKRDRVQSRSDRASLRRRPDGGNGGATTSSASSAVDRAIAALKLQYPTYARQLEVQFLASWRRGWKRSGTGLARRIDHQPGGV